MSAASASSSRSAARRLIKELDTWRAEAQDEKGIERLGPVGEDDLLVWEAVFNGRGVDGGYEDGRWLLSIKIPPNYPLSPPAVRFVTPIVHPNISLETGEICLDLLGDAWTPAYSVLETVRAVREGLLPHPEVDSPLNVDCAALLRDGDALGARRLVELWCSSREGRYEGA